MIETKHRLEVLERRVHSLGIPVNPEGTKLKKSHYVRALQKAVLKQRYGDNIPWPLRFMTSIDSLQLCKRFQTLREVDQARLFDSDEWVAEQKIDGVRMVIIWDASTKSFSFFSRNLSAQTLLPIDYRNNIYLPITDFNYPDNFVLDCEIVNDGLKYGYLSQRETTSALLEMNGSQSIELQKTKPLKFAIFDCLYDSHSLLNDTWEQRHEHAEALSRVLADSGLNCYVLEAVNNTKSEPNAKREFFDQVLEQGGEGVCFKHRFSKYNTATSRTNSVVKLKRTIADGLAHDIDAFVTDYVVGNDGTRNENMVVGFVFSVMLEKNNGSIEPHIIATCSNVSDYIKRDATIRNDDGSISLSPAYYGRVATLTGQAISSSSLRITHACINCFRFDKTVEGCEVLKESELRKLMF